VRIVDLVEWQQATPDTHRELRDVWLPTDRTAREKIDRLIKGRRIDIREGRHGLEVSTRSYVGSLVVGDVAIRVRPKVGAPEFSALLRYAIGLPRIELLPEHVIDVRPSAFQDLLVERLIHEASRLIARGLYRAYVAQKDRLSRPRGRLLIQELAREVPGTSSTLACRFHVRDENVLPNRVVLAGLRLGAAIALEPSLRLRAQRLASSLSDTVKDTALTRETFRTLAWTSNRLTANYEPAFALIRLLLAGVGPGLERSLETAPLRGFLLNMNQLFQDALGRFLREELEDAHVHEQHMLRGTLRYQPHFNPRRQHARTLRPDYVVSRSGRTVAILDAKYRDLWERDLGRDMLYQLSVYALAHPECNTAAILYPTTDPSATEARISVRNPVGGERRAQVCVRPVDMKTFAHLITTAQPQAGGRRRFASYLAYGRG
jgi:5-methylcytosine-specific restriction enzyme subunit McrC